MRYYYFVKCCIFRADFGSALTWKLLEILFWAVFNLFCLFLTFSVISHLKSRKNVWKWTKKRKQYFFNFISNHLPQAPTASDENEYLWKYVKNSSKKYFDQLSGARRTRKLLKIHNSYSRVVLQYPQIIT